MGAVIFYCKYWQETFLLQKRNNFQPQGSFLWRLSSEADWRQQPTQVGILRSKSWKHMEKFTLKYTNKQHAPHTNKPQTHTTLTNNTHTLYTQTTHTHWHRVRISWRTSQSLTKICELSDWLKHHWRHWQRGSRENVFLTCPHETLWPLKRRKILRTHRCVHWYLWHVFRKFMTQQ